METCDFISKLQSYDSGLDVIKDVVYKVYHSCVRGLRCPFGDGHRISGFVLTVGVVYAYVYWEHEDRTGTESVSVPKLAATFRKGEDYIIPAETESLGPGYGDEEVHPPIRITRSELEEAFRTLAARLEQETTPRTEKFTLTLSLRISGRFDPRVKTLEEAVRSAAELVEAEARSNAIYDGEEDGVEVTDVRAVS